MSAGASRRTMLVSTSVPLAPLTTLRLGGPAARLVEASSEAEIVEAVAAADAAGEPLLVLGGGSNVVLPDAGFPGLVVLVRSLGVKVKARGARRLVEVAAGEPLDALVARAVAEGWAGLEALAGIPGLVGATPLQNVGAYGQEVGEVVRRVRVLDRSSGAVCWLGREACGFAYRSSAFRGDPRRVVVAVELDLAASRLGLPVRYAELSRVLGVGVGGRAPLGEVREAVLALRTTKGMVVRADDPESVSAGSFFTNPVLGREELADVERRARECNALPRGAELPRFAAAGGRVKVPAAWLIEHAGFPRGTTRGAVGTSRKHALALVNRGGASSAELLALAREIRDRVLERFGVRLEPEPVIVGAAL